jgi:hypothetical protein
MALLQNGFRDFSSGVRIFGATVSNSAYPSALNRKFTSTQRNLTAGEGITSDLAGIPGGYRGQYAWVQPQKPGALTSRNEIEAIAALSASGAMGLNAVATLEGVALLEAVGQLVVSAAATIAGAGTLSANVVAALAASASLSASGSVSAAIDALAWAVASLQGQASSDFTPYATGELAATIDVAATADLTAGAIADEILDAQMVETGLSVRETLRLCAAALAGKISGAAGTTITIRNAVADDADRIVATVDADGNRTGITYDLA